MDKRISVEYEGKPCYEIYIEQDFARLPQLLRQLGYDNKRKVCIITDSIVASFYQQCLEELLSPHFSLCTTFVFPAGEESKNTETVGKAYAHLIEQAFDRRDLLIALGGGVVGDLTGFTAATYLRGIDFVQIPTTLLSQVDSSIGGKTGVDFMNYKNMVGAFYMPKLVFMNISVLKTLPDSQYFSGMGEILKHGQIKNYSYFEAVSDNYKEICKRDLDAVEKMIIGSCLIKRDVVQRDPKEQGERALLNFGHTIGHAIEKLSNFNLLHGQCVALGMVGAAYLSCLYGTYSIDQLAKLEYTLEKFSLPTRLHQVEFSPEDVLACTKLDKKMDLGKIKFILLNHPGEAYITKELNDLQLLEGIRYLFNKIGE